MVTLKRLLKMHNSTVLILPKAICRQLGVTAGDYVQIDVEHGSNAAHIHKINSLEEPYEPHPKHPHQPHR